MCFGFKTRGEVCNFNFIGYLDYTSINCVFLDYLQIDWVSKVEICWFFDTQ